jgi:ubiquinone biosynthesis protein UbiJ
VQNTDSPSAALTDTLRNSLLAAAEIGGNRLLAYDEAALAGCRELQGHCIAIEITDLDFRLYCHPGGWGIRLSQYPPPREAEASISGRLMALANLAAEEDKLATSMQERVAFHGDVKLAQKLQRILTGLDIDWEEALAGYIGDIAAFQVHQRARRLGEWFRQSADSLLRTTSEYLREETRASPTQVEFEWFQARVTGLRHDVSRAEARLARLLERTRPQ